MVDGVSSDETNEQPAKPSADGTVTGDTVPAPKREERRRLGRLIVHVQRSYLSGGMPKIEIDGRPVLTRFGDNVIGVSQGRHVVRVSSRWTIDYGHASLEVSVGSDETVDVWYSPPLNQWARKGSMGLTKQRPPDIAFMALVIAVAIVVSAFVVMLRMP